MKPILEYNIKDADDKIIFSFPLNTLLEKIIDVWPLIMSYYQNYYPFALEIYDGNYRLLTHEEFSTESCLKLFAFSYSKKRIQIINGKIGCTVIGINNFALLIKGKPNYIYLDRDHQKIGIYSGSYHSKLCKITEHINKLYICTTKFSHNNIVPLMVRSDIIFQ